MTAAGALHLKRFELNPDFEARLLSSPAVGSWLEGLGKLAVPEVQRRAPYRLGFIRKDVAYRIVVDRGRLILRIESRDFKSSWYERGTERTPARPFLRPGVTAALPGANWTAGAR